MTAWQIGYVSDLEVPKTQALLVKHVLIRHGWVGRVIFASEVMGRDVDVAAACKTAVKFQNRLLKSSEKDFFHVDAKTLLMLGSLSPAQFQPQSCLDEHVFECGVWSIDSSGRYCLPFREFFEREERSKYDYRNISSRPWYWKESPGYDFWLERVLDLLETDPKFRVVLEEDFTAGKIAPAVYADITGETLADGSAKQYVIPEFAPAQAWIKQIQSGRFKRRMKRLTRQNRVRRALKRNGVWGSLKAVAKPYGREVIKNARRAAGVVKRRINGLIIKQPAVHTAKNGQHGSK